jgi:hypothetical protein
MACPVGPRGLGMDPAGNTASSSSPVVAWRHCCHGEVFFSFLGVGWDWVRLARRPLTGLLYHPRMMDVECGAVGGMRIGRGNRSTWRKPAPVPPSPTQIPYDMTWARTRAAAVGSRRLTAWATVRSAERCLLGNRLATGDVFGDAAWHVLLLRT